MSYAFKSQTLLTLRFDSESDLSSATNPKILYRKPSGVKGEWVGTIAGREIIYDVQSNDITPGNWQFQIKYNIGVKVAYGTIVTEVFLDNLEYQ